MTRKGTLGEVIAIQSWLRPALTAVGANKDYEQFRDQLEAVNGLLGASHLEALAMEGREQASARERRVRKEFAMKALRVQVLKSMLGNPSYRSFSRMVAAAIYWRTFAVRTGSMGSGEWRKARWSARRSFSPTRKYGGCIRC